MKKVSLVIMVIFYLAAGINHFYNPEAYSKIIPPFFTNPLLINIASGAAEIIFGILLLIPSARKFACYGIICMLLAFIPAHICMLKVGWCIKGFCLPEWVLWIRLIVLQPLLIFWAWMLIPVIGEKLLFQKPVTRQ